MSIEQQKRLISIFEAISNNFYESLGSVELLENDDINIIHLKVIPYEGFHSNKPYFLKLNFQQQSENCSKFSEYPLIYIDSELFDKIKTNQYLKNQGDRGSIHKGICVKHLSYAYGFKNNFKNYCDNRWEVYVACLISVFNRMEDFEKGSGFKSNYREILGL
jgi:hypothetical protein